MTAEKQQLGISTEVNKDNYSVPTLHELGYPSRKNALKYHGGEMEALSRLQATVVERKEWVRAFSKPNTSPNSLDASTTVLSPYLRHGSLSPVTMFHELNKAIAGASNPSQPPVSLHGQLLWREFFYLHGATTPNFDRMEGNPTVRQIPWDSNEELLLAWKEGRTGYPYIDAIMRQLKQEGWVHHLARHSAACFLTRGDLWQHWEQGARVFEELLLDYDWSLNNANWQWLSCSNFFYQYFRCYSPVAFGKKTDPEGAYIKKYVPEVRLLPTKYIYEPYKAPKSVQIMCNCIIGKDYPEPIVDHESVSKLNMSKMKLAYALTPHVASDAQGDEDEDPPSKKSKTKK
jgi:cryptochrome